MEKSKPTITRSRFLTQHQEAGSYIFQWNSTYDGNDVHFNQFSTYCSVRGTQYLYCKWSLEIGDSTVTNSKFYPSVNLFDDADLIETAMCSNITISLNFPHW